MIQKILNMLIGAMAIVLAVVATRSFVTDLQHPISAPAASREMSLQSTPQPTGRGIVQQAHADDQTVHGPQDAVVVRYDVPMATEGVDVPTVHIVPALPLMVTWDESRTTMQIAPEEAWQQGATYVVTVGDGRTERSRRTVPGTRFAVGVPSLPTVVAITPVDNATDVVLDIEDPIVVTFAAPPSEDVDVDIRLSGDTPLTVTPTVVDGAPGSGVQALPATPLTAGLQYDLTVRTRWKGEDDTAWRTIGTSRFTMRPPAPDEWSAVFPERLRQAVHYTPAKIAQGRYIDINKATQVMTLFEDGKAVDAYMISSGRPGMDTPSGTWHVLNKYPRPWSKMYGLYMPYWMAITPYGHGIHELPEWPSGYKEGARNLGHAVSHGCVRLGVGPAQRVYDWTEVGTPVVVY